MGTPAAIVENAAPSFARQCETLDEPFVVRLSKALRDQLFRLVVESLPFECCGLLLGRRDGCVIDIESIVPAANVSAGDRRVSFEVNPQTLLDTIENERISGDSHRATCGFGQREYTPQLVGIYHSHPNGRTSLSTFDLESAWPGLVQLVIVASPNSECALFAWYKRNPSSMKQTFRCCIDISDRDE